MLTVKNHQSGQVLLITLLVLSIAATIGLSVIGRTTTDVAISNQIAESSRAFSAAEAGIEEALKTGSGTGGPQVLTSGVSYSVTRTDIGGAPGVYLFPAKTSRESAETLWLVNHNANGTLNETPTYTAGSLDLCWTSEVTTPAAFVTILYKSGGVYKIARGAYDPDNTRRASNNFSTVTATDGGCGGAGGTTYRQTLTFGSFGINPAVDTLLFLRAQPIYSDTRFAVNASQVLPLQGSRIESAGTSTGGITRKIIVFQQFRSPPSLFDSVIVSQGNFGH